MLAVFKYPLMLDGVTTVRLTHPPLYCRERGGTVCICALHGDALPETEHHYLCINTGQEIPASLRIVRSIGMGHLIGGLIIVHVFEVAPAISAEVPA
jgi:hypothetical protein